jgi:hypothetical protein
MKTPEEYLNEAQRIIAQKHGFDYWRELESQFQKGHVSFNEMDRLAKLVSILAIETAQDEALRAAVKHHRLSYDTDGISGGVSYFLVEDSILKLLKK